MKTKRFFSNLTCVILLICFVFLFFTYKTIASVQANEFSFLQESTSNVSEGCCGEEGGIYVSLVTSKTHFLPDENIFVEYSISGEEKIADFNYSQTGFNVLSVNVDEFDTSKVAVELSCVSEAPYHQLIIRIALQSGNNLTATLYAIYNEYGAFISPFSEDDARERYFDYAIASGLLSLEQCRTIRNECAKRSVVEETRMEASDIAFGDRLATTATTSSQDTYVAGLLQWKDDEGNVHPLRHVMVRIYDEETSDVELLATVYTDDTGFFSYAFDNPDGLLDFENGGYDIIVHVYAGDENVMVKIGNSNEDYYLEWGVYDNVLTGTTLDCSKTVLMDNDWGRAFQISQAIMTARDYARTMMGTTPSNVIIKYPFGSGCAYNFDSRSIRITGNARDNDSVPHSYASWDTLMHEYGHHIQYVLGNADSPHLDHYSDENDADMYQNKDIGIRLAWAESWPTVFALMAQQYYSNHLTNIATTRDTSYTSYKGLDYDIENNTHILLGDACERSIMSVLWDLYDSNSEPNDNISLGHAYFWAATTSDQIHTFSDFIACFYGMYPSYIKKIGSNLTYYKMASSKPWTSTSNVSQTEPPRFNWYAQGGSERFPNNSFSLIFYDSLGIEILRTTSTASSSYILTSSEWDSVLHSYGTKYTVAVVATQTDSPVTGGYISPRSVTYTKPTPSNLTETVNISANNRYTEKIIDLQPGQYIEYRITFAGGGNKLIQTFGPRDAIMDLYDENGTLLDSDDDSGHSLNAFLSYDVTQGEEYVVRLYFYDEDQSDIVKLAIIQTQAYTDYEDIHGCDKTVIQYTTSLSQNQVAIVRYHTSPTGTVVTFTSEASFDTYLYVIDPRSAAPISSSGSQPSTYNDDGAGNLQAKITKTLDGGVPYLVILCAYNPANSTGLCYLNFD